MICSDENMRLLVRTRQKSLMITDVFVECSMGSNASYQLLKTKVVAEPRCSEPTPIQLVVSSSIMHLAMIPEDRNQMAARAMNMAP